MHDADTRTDTAMTEIAAVNPDSMLYLSSRLTKPLIEAAVVGARHGLLTRADLPLEMPDGPAFLAAVHKVLDETGALAARRTELQMDSKVATCPWWCWGEHEAVYDGTFGVAHEQKVLAVTYDEDEPEASELVVYIGAMESGEGAVEAPVVCMYGAPENLSAGGARVLAEALVKAADRLDEITAGTR